MRDGSATLLPLEEGGADDERVHWSDLTMEFSHTMSPNLAGASGSAEAPKTAKGKTWYRLASFDQLVAIDAQLRRTTGAGLRRYMVPGVGNSRRQQVERSPGFQGHIDSHAKASESDAPESERRQGLAPPVFTFLTDQGPIPSCMAHFMLNHLRLRCVVLWDPWHRWWNDLKNGVQEGGLWGCFLAMCIPWNLAYGPWQGEKNFVDLVEAIRFYEEVGQGTQDTLYSSLAQHMWRDTGVEEPPIHEEAWKAMWTSIFDSKLWRIKGPKVAMSRWMGWLDCCEFFQEDWWKRVMSLAVVGLLQGWLFAPGSKELLSGLTPQSLDAKSTKESKEKTQRLRDKCRNSMHVSFVLMSDVRMVSRCRMIHYCCLGSRALFGQCVSQARDPQSTLVFYQALALGEGHLEACRKFASPWRDIGILSKIGMQCELSEYGKRADFDATHPVVLHNAELAAELGRLTLSLMRSRLRSLGTHMWAFPGRFPELLHTDPACVARCLQDMKRVWGHWHTIKNANNAAWQRLVKTCSLGWEYVDLVFQECAKAQFERVTPVVDELVRCVFEGFGNTKLCEDAIKVCRDMQRNNPDMRPSSVNIFRRPYLEHVLSDNHRFKEVESDEVPVPERVMTSQLPPDFFRPKYRESSMDFTELAGRKQKTDWMTLNAAGERALAEHVPIMCELAEAGGLENISQTWRAAFFPAGLLVRRGAGDWEICLGPLVTGILCWKAEKVKLPGGVEAFDFAEATKSNISVRAVTSFDGWQVREMEWLSPAQLFVLNRRRAPASWPKCWLRAKTGPMSVLKVAAANCFWNLGVQALRRLIQHHYPDLAHLREQDLADMLAGVVAHELGCKEQATADILEKRALATERSEEVMALTCAESQDVLDNRDAAVVSKFVADQEEQAASRAPLARKVVALRSGGSRKKRRTAVGTVRTGTLWTEAEARLLLPPRGSISRDTFNGRWRCYYAGQCTKSRSWGERSDEDCVLWLARWCWHRHEEVTGETCPFSDLPSIGIED